MNFLNMSGFQLEAAVILAAAIFLCPVHWVLIARRRPRPGLGVRTVRRYSGWERLVHLGLVVSFLVVACTGFYASIRWGGPMTGYMLMIHTTFGAVFAVTALFMLITWAADHAFSKEDGRWMTRGGCLSAAGNLPAGRFDAGQKIYFWFAGLAALAALLTMILSMVPLLGTAGQTFMYTMHRWWTLALAVATIWHVYMTVFAKPGTWWSLVSGYVGSAWADLFHPQWGRNK
jgi:formate dehydrogenase subunit gamma